MLNYTQNELQTLLFLGWATDITDKPIKYINRIANRLNVQHYSYDEKGHLDGGVFEDYLNGKRYVITKNNENLSRVLNR